MTTRFLFDDPATLRDVQASFDRIFKGVSDAFGTPAQTAVPVSLGEDAAHLYVEAVVPGVEPKSFEITVENDQLRIRGERTASAGDEVRWFRRDRPTGAFDQRLRLKLPVNRDAIAAEYRNGILTITLPKAETVLPKQIEVKAL